MAYDYTILYILTNSEQTVIKPAATTYAACADPYLVNSVNGKGIAQVYDDANKYWPNNDETSAYDCCVACVSNPSCAAAAFAPSYPVGEQCLLDVSDSCPRSPAVALYGAPGTGMTISNGYCGGYQSVL